MRRAWAKRAERINEGVIPGYTGGHQDSDRRVSLEAAARADPTTLRFRGWQPDCVQGAAYTSAAQAPHVIGDGPKAAQR